MRLAWPVVAGVLAGLAAFGGQAVAAVAVSATRVVYLAGDRERTLMLANVGEAPLLVQSWVDRGEGTADGPPTPFVVLPAVLLLNPDTRQTLRVLHNGEAMAKDRESVFWVNFYQIPATKPETSALADSARLDVAMNLQIKVFYRPEGLARPLDEDATAKALGFRLAGVAGECSLVVRNPTPFHVSFSRLGLREGDQQYPAEQAMDMMIAPFAERSYRLQDQRRVGQDVRRHGTWEVAGAMINDAGQEHVFVAPVELEAGGGSGECL